MKNPKHIFILATVFLFFLALYSPILLRGVHMHFGKTVTEKIQVAGWKICCYESTGKLSAPPEHLSWLKISDHAPLFPAKTSLEVKLPSTAAISTFLIKGNYPPGAIGQKITVSMTCTSKKVEAAPMNFVDAWMTCVIE